MSEPIVRHNTRKSVRAARWGWALVAATGAALAAALGVWQLDRAAQKQAMAQQVEDKKKLPPLTNKDLLAIGSASNTVNDAALSPTVNLQSKPELAALVQRTVVLQGYWMHAHTVYLQNRPMERQQGFYVVTPLQLRTNPADPTTEKTHVIMVQRGWVQRDFQDLNKVPLLAQSQGLVEVKGRLLLKPSTVFNLSTQAQAGHTSGAGAVHARVRQNLDISDFSSTTGLPLVPMVVLQTDADSDVLKRAWPAVDSGVDKHYGYAFQWFSLSALIVALWVWLQWIAPRRRLAGVDGSAAVKSEQQGNSDAE